MLRLSSFSATMAACAALCASPLTATMTRSSHLPVAMCDAAAATATKDMSMSMPPDSFKTLIADAADATDAAIADGTKLIEIEFPPLPISKLDDSSVSSYDVLAANLQFVIEFTKNFA